MSRNKQNEIKLNARPFHLVLSKGLLTKEEFGGVLGSVKFGSKLGLFLFVIVDPYQPNNFRRYGMVTSFSDLRTKHRVLG